MPEEARLGASLTHPAIATVFDYGFHHDNPFTVFEYIEGETLRELIERRGRLPLDEVRLIVGPLAQALDFAHARRIVHRDLKPENIRATEQRQFKILDLGLAREFSRQDDWRFAGTPPMPPPSRPPSVLSDGRTDQYALAVIVFELLDRSSAVREQLVARPTGEALFQPAAAAAEPGTRPPETVDEAILKALEKDPNQRFSTCTELAVALGCQFLTGPAALCRNPAGDRDQEDGRPVEDRTLSIRSSAPRTHLALAPDALWAIHRTELMRWPLAVLHDLRRRVSGGCRFGSRGCRQGPAMAPLQEPQGGSPLAGIARVADLRAGRGSRTAAAMRWRPGCRRPRDQPDPRVEPVVLLTGGPARGSSCWGGRGQRPQGAARRAAWPSVAAMMGADAVVDLNAESCRASSAPNIAPAAPPSGPSTTRAGWS